MNKTEKIREMLAVQIEQAHKLSTEILTEPSLTSKNQMLQVAKLTEAMASAATAYAKLDEKPLFPPFSSLFSADDDEDDEEEDEKPIEQGQTVKLKDTKDSPEFIVLDTYEDGTALIFTRKAVGQSEFGGKNYSDKDCELRKQVEKWLEDMAARGLNLDDVTTVTLMPSGWNGGEKIKAKAYPLTLDEYLYYREKVPAIRESASVWWLRTEYGGGSFYYVYSSGVIGYDWSGLTYGVRPALRVLTSCLLASNNK